MWTYVVLAIIGIVVAEVCGYFLHGVLHLTPEWFEKRRWAKPFQFLCRSHMGHHGLGYGPRMLQRPSPRYFFIRNPGNGKDLEKMVKYGWLYPEFSIPAAPVVVVYFLTLVALDFSWVEILWTMGSTAAWVAFAFLYVHDAFHKTDHWLGRIPIVGWWFRTMRDAHDLHHTIINDRGEVPYNLGIMMPIDVLFGTWHGPIKGLHIEPRIGQVQKTPLTEERYRKFHEVYKLHEPPFDKYADDEIRHLIKYDNTKV